MKTLSVIGLICCCSCCIYGTDKGSIPEKEIIIGRDLRSNTDIKATEYVFPETIYRWSMNDSANMLTVQLRGIPNDKKDTLAGMR